jgi:hypothetical protein
VRAQGTAGRGMRRDDRDAHLVFAGLDLVNLHLIAEEEATDCFPSRPRFSVNTVRRVLLESSISSLLPLPSTSSIPWLTKVGHEPFNVGIYNQGDRTGEPFSAIIQEKFGLAISSR